LVGIEPHATPAASLEAAMVARRYYIDDRQKSEIATEMGISRFKVARLIDEARASGIVRISVDIPAEVDLALGQRLADHFRIQRSLAVRVVDTDPGGTGAILGSAAAGYLSSKISEADVVGVSWGSTLTHTVNALGSLAAGEIVQLVGGVQIGRMEDSGVELVRRLAAKSNGRAFPLHAPLLVRTAEMAAALRDDPGLDAAISRYTRLTMALVGIGSWVPPMSSLYQEFSPNDRATLIQAGAAGDLCSLVFDSTGQALTAAPLDRLIGITLDELRRVPEVIAVAGSTDKANAIAAVLRSGVVDTLITDIPTARKILEL
jgi:DNA-binding transcriptional regulator LsrR (DeoR family)